MRPHRTPYGTGRGTRACCRQGEGTPPLRVPKASPGRVPSGPLEFWACCWGGEPTVDVGGQ